MKANGTLKIVFMLFLPAILNIGISMIIAWVVVARLIAEGAEPSRFGVEIARTIYTYNFYWSILQVVFGVYFAKKMGWTKWLKEKYSPAGESVAKSLLLIAGLATFSLAVIFSEQFINAAMFGGWERYMEYWKLMVGNLPWWSKLYMVAIAPFTAGIFEEIIWRGYGIDTLEKRIGSNKAVLVQAIAFGFWHGISFHIIITFIIGLVYGLVYLRKRKLLQLTLAHIVTDVVGFAYAFL